MRVYPLCVDLDGTLIKEDSSVRVFLKMLAVNPWRFFQFPLVMLKGRVELKIWSAGFVRHIRKWTFNEELLAFLEDEKKSGRKLYLATGAHVKVASAVVADLNLFDGIYGTEDTVNFVAENKAAKLVEEFGEREFDYIGNSTQDLAVWRRSRQGMVANAGASLVARAKLECEITRVFPKF